MWASEKVLTLTLEDAVITSRLNTFSSVGALPSHDNAHDNSVWKSPILGNFLFLILNEGPSEERQTCPCLI